MSYVIRNRFFPAREEILRILSSERLALLLTLAETLGHQFHDYLHLDRALTHRSYANEVNNGISDNERYEFLGDAVLELAITHILCDQFPEMDEGDLSKIRASSVNKKTLARIARGLDLGQYLLLSRGEEQSKGHKKSSILADSFEAIIAAIYLDGGLEAAFHFVSKYFMDIFNNLTTTKMIVVDFKTRLQEISQALYHLTPGYKLVDEIGPDHAKEFVIKVMIKGKSYGTGTGSSKKEAEQAAAREAMKVLKMPKRGSKE
jgi:ribonuclease III